MAADGKLEYCLDSLVAQTIRDYEIIAVDDASTDSSLEILRAYEKRYPDKFVVIALEENHRQGGAKNAALEICRGEYVGFVDSDDWLLPEAYETLVRMAEEQDADIAGCDLCLVNDHVMEPSERIPSLSEENAGELTAEKKGKLLLGFGALVTMVYERHIFMEPKLRFPEHIFYEDNAIAVLPFLYAKRFERVDEALYFYLQDASSTVHNVSIERCKNRMTAMEILKGELQKRGFYEKLHTECDYKIFELGYKNTLFSYLQSEKHPDKTFVAKLREYLLCHIPAFERNPYIREHTDARTLQMAKLHRKGTGCFLLFYKLVQSYRSLRNAT